MAFIVFLPGYAEEPGLSLLWRDQPAWMEMAQIWKPSPYPVGDEKDPDRAQVSAHLEDIPHQQMGIETRGDLRPVGIFLIADWIRRGLPDLCHFHPGRLISPKQRQTRLFRVSREENDESHEQSRLT